VNKLVLVTLCVTFYASAASGQVYPVLYDADDTPIGYVIGLDSTPVGRRVVQMVSRQGYVAELQFENQAGAVGYNDELGSRLISFYESTDCSGDPIVLPYRASFSHGINSYPNDGSEQYIARLDQAVSRIQDGLETRLHHGDLVEYNGGVYYVPLDADSGHVWVRSYNLFDCTQVDRCNSQDRATLSHLIGLSQYDPENLPPGGLCDGEPPPSWQLTGIMATGFYASSLVLNDPAVTGFESTAFAFPVRIKYVDIGTLLADGFEQPPP
jgi:hypothetical protein